MSKFNALENPWDTSISVSVETVSQQISNLETEELSREGLIQAVTGLFGNVFNTLRLSVNEVFKVLSYLLIILSMVRLTLKH